MTDRRGVGTLTEDLLATFSRYACFHYWTRKERGSRDPTTCDVEVSVIERLKLYDWTFSATAETVVGALLAVLLGVSIFAFRII